MTAPIVHAGDPVTSREAAEHVTASGQRATLMQRVFEVVTARPGLCCSEYAALLGLDRVQVARRLTDLAHQGRA